MIGVKIRALFHAWRLRILLGLLATMAALYGLQSLRLSACKSARANDAMEAAERIREASVQAVRAADAASQRRAGQAEDLNQTIEGLRDEGVTLVCDSPAVRSAVERVWGETADSAGHRPD